MIIVYFSIAVIVVSFAYLGFVAFKAYKAAKPSIENLQETANRVQSQTDAIKEETDKLSFNQQKLITDFEKKKKAVNTVVFSVKQTPVEFKNALKFKPVAALERQCKARQWNQNQQRNRTAETQY